MEKRRSALNPTARSSFALAALAFAFALACSEQPESSTETASAKPASSGEAAAAEPAKKQRRRERPLPNFGGWTLEDERLEISQLIGKRLLLFFFNPEVKQAETVGRAVTAVAKESGDHNFRLVGISMGSNRDKTSAFVRSEGIDFPVIDDSTTAIAQRLGLRSPVAVIGVDGEGYVSFGFAQFVSEGENPEGAIEMQLRSALRLPAPEATVKPELGEHPKAPPFAGDVLDGDRFDLASQSGRAVVLIFFLHTCPHCHETLTFLKGALEEIPEDRRPALVGVEITGQTAAVRAAMKKEGLDYFPVIFDDDGSIRSAYGIFAGVPDTFLIDAKGRIVSRVEGWRGERDATLIRMRLAKMTGSPVPMLLSAKGYSGSETCGVCHENEHETWLFTTHASAFDTLVKHGADRNEECIGCHVVGWEKSGGYTSSIETADLENVGCESCHGRGGPHLSPDFVKGEDYAGTCAGCHDQKHSLGFEYASFVPKVSHAANAHLVDLPLAEKKKLLGERAGPRDVLPKGADHVGSDACQSCHEAEYATWLANPHAKAVKTLEAKGEQANADCLKCHTTGFDRAGGFPSDGAPGTHADLARVGCESCHGPGGDHVEDGAKKLGTIVSLGDKCDSCVILQICGSCHDDANDPGFEFEVQAKIERLRHGTIEAGTGEPLGKSASNSPALSDSHVLREGVRPEVLIGHAFDLLDDRG